VPLLDKYQISSLCASITLKVCSSSEMSGWQIFLPGPSHPTFPHRHTEVNLLKNGKQRSEAGWLRSGRLPFVIAIVLFLSILTVCMVRQETEMQAMTLREKYAMENLEIMRQSQEETQRQRHEIRHHVLASKIKSLPSNLPAKENAGRFLLTSPRSHDIFMSTAWICAGGCF